MIKPQEKIIAAFLDVWEKEPEVFYNSGAVDGLTQLQEKLIEASEASVGEIYEILNEWCENYEEVAVAVTSRRKIKPENNAPTRQEEDNTLDNRYPEISKVLRERLKSENQEEDKTLDNRYPEISKTLREKLKPENNASQEDNKTLDSPYPEKH